jgi:hypothetical protein
MNSGVKGVCIVHPVEEAVHTNTGSVGGFPQPPKQSLVHFKELADLFRRYKASDDELRGFVILWQYFEGLWFVLNIRRRTGREREGPFRTIIGMRGTAHWPPMTWAIFAIHPTE